MITVEIRNFQSIERTSLRIEGFTALVGRSNIGKSAVVRAVKAALTNELGTSFVRHARSSCARERGGKSCKCAASVHIVRAPDFDLLWEKGDADNRYTFNGVRYDKPGQGIPEFLLQSGLAPVKIGNDSESIQVADQFFPIFLLNQSGTAAAEAISDVARLDKISTAMKSAEKDRRDFVSVRKVRGQDILALEAKLGSFEGLDAACGKAKRSETSLLAVDACGVRLGDLTSYGEKTSALVVDLRALSQASKTQVPKIEPLQDLWSKVEEQTDLHTRLLSAGNEYKRLLGVDKLGAPPEINPLVEAKQELQSILGWLARMKSFQVALERMGTADKSLVPAFEPVSEQRGRAKVLAGYASRFLALSNQKEKLETEVDSLKTEEASVQAEIDALGGVCPTCSQPVVGHDHA